MVEIYKCSTCRSFFLADYVDYFEAALYDYYRVYDEAPENSIYDELTTKSYRNVLSKFLGLVGKGEILDIGCGKGDFVRVATREGWQATGIDLSESAVRIAQRFSIPVVKLDFLSKDIFSNSYDIITMFEVLEHLQHPVQFLRKAESVIRSGGLLYITTPNFNSLDRMVLAKNWEVIHREHLTYFTPSTLRSIIQENTSFRIVDIETRNLSPKLVGKLRFLKRILYMERFENSSTDFSSDLRYRIEESFYLRNLKSIINWFLRYSALGNTIVVTLQRP